MKRWEPGDVVIVRDRLETRGTRAYEALTGDTLPNLPGWPYIVLEDTPEKVVLYLPEGTKLWRWNIVEQRLREPRVTQGDSVRFMFEDRTYAVDLFFETGTGPAPWVKYLLMGEPPPSYAAPIITRPANAELPSANTRFYGWKVDLVSPFRRTALGFDVADEVLDIVVWPDRSYRWKDEDQMERLVSLDVYSEAEVRMLRQGAEEVIGLIESGRAPFDAFWPLWRPPAQVVIPVAPEGWQYMPLGQSEWGELHAEALAQPRSPSKETGERW